MHKQKHIFKQALAGKHIALFFLLFLPILAGAVPAPLSGGWWAEYFPNQTLNGAPVQSRFDESINFDWGTGSPGPGAPADNFSVRWTRDEWFDSGAYRFSARSDDGIRLWVGDLLVIDAWHDQQASWIVRDTFINRGTYPVRVEYYENQGGAQVYLSWERITGGQGWNAEYFDNRELQGNPVLFRTDPAISWSMPGTNKNCPTPTAATSR